MYDIVGAMMRFESGDMDDSETLDFFQVLVNTGMAWKLQGYYGRMAAALIDQGLVSDDPTVH